MQIRPSRQEDLPVMLEIYEEARRFMQDTGNPTQWNGNYPEAGLLMHDIELGNSFVVEENAQVIATFALIIGEDPTYRVIEDGAWLNENPYGTVHRLAARTAVHGVANYVFDWCKGKVDNLRADTHEDNKVMQHILEKNGFVRCGRIYVADGTPRIAFQFMPQIKRAEMQEPFFRDGQDMSFAAARQEQGAYQQEMSQPNWMQQGQPVKREERNQGFGIASMVLGIISIVLFFAFINLPLAILAVVFGGVQLAKGGQKGMAVAGIITGEIAIFLTVIAALFFCFNHMAEIEYPSDINEGSYYYDAPGNHTSQDYYQGYYDGYYDGYDDAYSDLRNGTYFPK